MAESKIIPKMMANIPIRWCDRTRSFRKRCARTTVTAGEEVAIGVTMETRPTRSPRYHAKKPDTSIRPKRPNFNQLVELPTELLSWPGASASGIMRAGIETRVRRNPIR